MCKERSTLAVAFELNFKAALGGSNFGKVHLVATV